MQPDPLAWTHRAVIAVPLALAPIASEIARAMDPDTGGAESFSSTRAGNPATHAICDTPLTWGTAQAWPVLMSSPEALHAACSDAYAARWPDLQVPSLEDCTTFLADAQIVVEERGRALAEVLAEWGLELTVETAP